MPSAIDAIVAQINAALAHVQPAPAPAPAPAPNPYADAFEGIARNTGTIYQQAISRGDMTITLQRLYQSAMAVEQNYRANNPSSQSISITFDGSTLSLPNGMTVHDSDIYSGTFNAGSFFTTLSALLRQARGYEEGGIVGNGVWGRDSVLALHAGGDLIKLAGGEHVMPADQTARYLPQLEAMRAGIYPLAPVRATPASNDNAVVSELRGVRQTLVAIDARQEQRDAALHSQLTALRAENAALRRRLEDLEGQRPRVRVAGSRG